MDSKDADLKKLDGYEQRYKECNLRGDGFGQYIALSNIQEMKKIIEDRQKKEQN